MNILFLGSCLPKEFEKKFKTISAAANQYQNNLINALKLKHDVHLISHIGLNDVILSSEEKQKLSEHNVNVFLPKVEGYRNFFRYRKIIKNATNNSDYVIAYNLVYIWFYLDLLIRRKNTKLILILADYTPPEEENGWRKIYSWLMKKQISRFDKIILLSEGSKKFIKHKKYEIINGCIDWNTFASFPRRNIKEKFNIVYTGVLNRITGVDLLLKAFSKLSNADYQLIICGQTDQLFELEIKKCCLSDPRIKYMGYLSKEEYYEVLREADLFVNPRNVLYEQNRYNFPSKIIEYLGTGRAIVSTKFIGYESYSSYINFCDSTPEDIAKCIYRVYQQIEQDRNIYYLENRKYIQQYSWTNMVDRFLV